MVKGNKVYEVLDLEQGSDEWLEERLNNFCSSEASAVMGDSKYMSRNQLLALKKGWQSNPDSEFKKQLYQSGHDNEKSAREIFEIEYLTNIPPVVLRRKYKSLLLLASYDGFIHDAIEPLIWEHKTYNETLAENVRNNILEPHYYWQIEHLCLVSGGSEVYFHTSDGTIRKKAIMIYKSDPKRRKALLAGYKQFNIDLKNFELEAKKENILPAKVESFPAINYEVKGTEIISNIQDCLPIIRERAEKEINRTLETDNDFKQKDTLNKAVVKARDRLKTIKDEIQSKFTSLDSFMSAANEIDSILQKMQSAGEKAVTNEKKRRKDEISESGKARFKEYLLSVQDQLDVCFVNINCNFLPVVLKNMGSFDLAMKNKRSLEKCQDAVDEDLAQRKVEVSQMMDETIIPNIEFLNDNCSGHPSLFNDIIEFIEFPHEAFKPLAEARVYDEEKRLQKIKDEAKQELISDASQSEQPATGYLSAHPATAYLFGGSSSPRVTRQSDDHTLIEDSFLPEEEAPVNLMVTGNRATIDKVILILRNHFHGVEIIDDNRIMITQ